jgi:hypothetical protein
MENGEFIIGLWVYELSEQRTANHEGLLRRLHGKQRIAKS